MYVYLSRKTSSLFEIMRVPIEVDADCAEFGFESCEGIFSQLDLIYRRLKSLQHNHPSDQACSVVKLLLPFLMAWN